jgi:hypothetical protein
MNRRALLAQKEIEEMCCVPRAAIPLPPFELASPIVLARPSLDDSETGLHTALPMVGMPDPVREFSVLEEPLWPGGFGG